MAARPRSPGSLPASSTRAPTTSASISSPQRAPARCPGTARWPGRWDCRDQHGADTRLGRQHRVRAGADRRGGDRRLLSTRPGRLRAGIWDPDPQGDREVGDDALNEAAWREQWAADGTELTEPEAEA